MSSRCSRVSPAMEAVIVTCTLPIQGLPAVVRARGMGLLSVCTGKNTLRGFPVTVIPGTGPGFIGAERVAGQRIAGIGERACARTAAQGSVFALAALSPECAGSVERLEQRRVAIDVDQVA